MKTVGVRTLRNRLSEYLRAAQDGERFAVTRRGVVVARLVPPEAGGESREGASQRLERAEGVRLGKPNLSDRYPPPPGLVSSEEVRAALDWVRGEG